jgi:hypothetical protein
MNFLKQLILIGVSFFCLGTATAQVDTVPQAESTRTIVAKPSIQKSLPKTVRKVDSLSNAPETVQRNTDTAFKPTVDSQFLADTIKKELPPKIFLPDIDTGTYQKYETHPYLPLRAPAIFMVIDYHLQNDKDNLFYLMTGLIFFLALIRVTFPKYFRNLFVLFLQTSLRQKQTRDQLLQDNLASLLINLLFFISAGIYISLFIQFKHWSHASFWVLAPLSALLLISVYLVKFLFLQFAGWVFNTREAAGSYTFIVFMVNKVIGVALIPFLLILAFSLPAIMGVSVTVSLLLLGGLFIYRYLISFSVLRTKLKVNAMHFFLYLCAVELLPLVLIYKLLIKYIAGSF